MAADVDIAADEQAEEPAKRTFCSAPVHLKTAVPARNQHYSESLERRRRVLNIATWIAAGVSASFTLMEILTTHLWPIALINGVTALVFAAIPLLHRFGELVAPLVLIGTAYVSLTVVCLTVGTGTGVTFYFLVSAVISVLVLGIDRIALAIVLVAIGAGLAITLQFAVPAYTGVQPLWAYRTGFVISTISSCAMIIATVWFALRETERAEVAMEKEYERSESLLANILPASIATRLKDPTTTVIADKYDDASVLFADIAGYTERASHTTPAILVAFLNQLYTEFDRLVERHGLEKVKTSGDCYMVVSGVPEPRPDHLAALACLALNMAESISGLTDHNGRAVPLRIGLGVGPVVAGVVGERRFFYDVWGDPVNVASRMESTGIEGRIQVPQEIYERLKDEFVFEERGDMVVKGKGVMHTWFLVGRRAPGTNLVGQSAHADGD